MPGTSALRRPDDRQLCARRLAGQRSVRLPGLGRATHWPAKLARPIGRWFCCRGRRIRVLRYGWDTLVRHGARGVGARNNGIWALEKHPMEMLYGYSVVADLRPGTRYDEVVRARRLR